MVALSVVTITYLTDTSTSFTPLIRTTLEQEKALELATGGIQIALSQLAGIEQKQQKNAAPAPQAPGAAGQQKPAQQTDEKTLLKTLLPSYNRWQSYTLKKEKDGINAVVQICITAEDGKININELYDFKKHAFINEGQKERDGKKYLQMIFKRMAPFVGGKELFGVFEKFLKDRQYKLQDVTELLAIKEFQVFQNNLFYQPPEVQSGQEKKEKPPLFLTDLFTVSSGPALIEPWLLSSSVALLFDFKITDSSKKESKESMEQLLNNFKPQATWATDWDKQLTSRYGKNFKALPEGLAPFLNPTFKPTKFSVLSYAKVGKIVQKVLAIVERTDASQDGLHDVFIRKIYWL
jgi:hypothetical protein